MAGPVLYVVSLFPCWSETFIVRELQALVQTGLPVRIASLRPHQEPLVQPDAEALRPQVIYPSAALRLLGHALGMIARRPLKSAVWFGRLTAGLWRQPGYLWRSYATMLVALDWAWRMRQAPPERIHAHFATYPSTAAMLLADWLEVPFSFTCHAHDIFIQDHLLRLKIARAETVVTISNFNVEFLRARLGSLAKQPVVVHCGVNPEEFAPTETARAERLIVAVGRLDEIKGFAFLIQACAALQFRGVDFRCEIVGEGPERPALERLIAEHGLGQRVRLLGLRGQAEVRRLVGAATLFALPSVRDRTGNMDGIPVALMEAMALGTPVVTTRVSGIPELVEHQRTGWLCAPGEVAALADGLAALLTDPALRSRLAEAARRKVEAEFDCRAEAHKLITLLTADGGANAAAAASLGRPQLAESAG